MIKNAFAGLLVALVFTITGCNSGGSDDASVSQHSADIGSNAAPVANAGLNQNIVTGTLVTLDGSFSTDANGDLLTYTWALTSKPSNSTAKLSSATVVKPSFVADVDGAYTFDLVVNDGKVNSAVSTVTVSATAASSNAVPVANAGKDQNVLTGVLVLLDGSASTDANGDFLTYDWVIAFKPAGSSATLSSPAGAKPTFVADVAGRYILNLIVNDGYENSSVSTVTVTATSSGLNVAPAANAGVNQNVATGTVVVLDGSGSSDANNDLLTYSWAFTSKPIGSSSVLSNGTDVKPTFVPDLEGTYVFSLTVSDGKLISSISNVSVTATAASVTNAAPVANAGLAQNVVTGALVTLDGSASSDADGDLLTYTWTFTSRPAASGSALSNATVAKPTFVPDAAGTYVFSLVVNDGEVSSNPSTVTVTATTASGANAAPVANAGVSQNVVTGALVVLDGSSSSDANGDLLNYKWTFASKPTGSGSALSSATAAKPTFVADVDGTFVLSLVVNDGKVDSIASTVTVTATSASVANAAPVANAGVDQNVNIGTFVMLDGSGSSDADGDPLTYSWAFTSKPTGSGVVLSRATVVNPTFTPDVEGNYVLRLTVNDGKAGSAASTIIVTATSTSANAAPVANAGVAQQVVTGTLVTLSGRGSSDANGDPLTYIWSFTSKPIGSKAVLSGGSTVNPSFTPDVAGGYELNLVVYDGKVNSDPSRVTVTASDPKRMNIRYVARNGMTVTLTSFATVDTGTGYTYTGSYTQSNLKTASIYDGKLNPIYEGRFKLYFSNGTALLQDDFFGAILYGDTLTRTFSFSTKYNMRPWVLEYDHGNYDGNLPVDGSLQWIFPIPN